MAWVGAVAALVLITAVLIDGFESILLPRRVSHPYRLARLFYRSGWQAWRAAACLFPSGRRRQNFLSIFGPLSLLALLALWAAGLIVGFALLHWSLGTAMVMPAGTDSGFPPTCTSAASPFSRWVTATWCRPARWGVS